MGTLAVEDAVKILGEASRGCFTTGDEFKEAMRIGRDAVLEVQRMADKRTAIREIEQKIALACVACGAVQFLLDGSLRCTRGKCPKKRVQGWLDQVF